MFLYLHSLAVGAVILSGHLGLALSPSDISADTPVSQLVSSANAQLAAGNSQDALTYFDIAVSRDPTNYLTLFKRGATYLSLGKAHQAQQDFDRVLAIKPDFEGALLQRAKIKSRNGDWTAARRDYEVLGHHTRSEIAELEEAQGAAVLAMEAENRGDWDTCISQATVAIQVAGAAAELRKLRARCRFARGAAVEGVSDLQHVLHLTSGSTEPHLQSSATTFYSVGDTDKGLSYIRKCLQSDPDSKPCRKMMKREKELVREVKRVREMIDERQFNSAAKLLVGTASEPGLLKAVKEDTEQYQREGVIHKNCAAGLYADLVDVTCEAYVEMNNYRKAEPICREALSLNPSSYYGLVSKVAKQIDDEDYEPALQTLDDLEQRAGRTKLTSELRTKARKLLNRSKQKDYYKVLGLDRDADDKEIKRAYRKATLRYHPDKATKHGVTKEEAEKKMAAVNEAYEVLGDPELKARFDRGDDPNNQQQGNPFQGSPFGGGGQSFFFGQSGFPGGGEFKFQRGGFQFP